MCKALEEYKQECYEIGYEIGFSKGYEDEAQRIAKNLLEEGLQLDLIASLTGLSINTLLELSKH